MQKLVLALVLAVCLASCDPGWNAREPSLEQAQAIVNSMIYVRAENGLCYGVSLTPSEIVGARTNWIVVHVPCESVSLG